MKKLITSGLLAGIMTVSAVIPALAADVTVGNDAVTRPNVDSYSNFVIVDTNNPVNADGKLTEFHYYASNTNPFKFLVVDTAGTVKWISNEITPASSGAQSYSADVQVETGWNLGVYFSLTGTIPYAYDSSAEPAKWTPNSSGAPTLNATLNYDHSYDTNPSVTDRIYSFGATGVINLPTTKDQCKKGNWETFGVFKNQGDCVSFVATGGKNLPANQ